MNREKKWYRRVKGPTAMPNEHVIMLLINDKKKTFMFDEMIKKSMIKGNVSCIYFNFDSSEINFLILILAWQNIQSKNVVSNSKCGNKVHENSFLI